MNNYNVCKWVVINSCYMGGFVCVCVCVLKEWGASARV